MCTAKKIRVLSQKLKKLEKLYGLPPRPSSNPISLYIDEALKKQAFSPPGLGSNPKELMKQFFKQANDDWRVMEATKKIVYVEKSEKLREEHKKSLKDWMAVFGDSHAQIEMDQIKEELKILRANEKNK